MSTIFKRIIAVIIAVIFVGGIVMIWQLLNQSNTESDATTVVCATHDDCKLIYSNCDCEAVTATDSRKALVSDKVCIWNSCYGQNIVANCIDNQCVKSMPAATTTSYLVSTADKLKFCNGADMDSDGYRKTITKEVIATISGNATMAQTAKNIAVLATDGQCQEALTQLEFTVDGDTVTIPPIDGWAGISIAMCSCKPEVEVNLLRLPGIKHIVWE